MMIGIAADSGCGKSTFMKRIVQTLGAEVTDAHTPQGDLMTVICLDDYHLNDRAGRKVSGKTALNVKEQKFDLMYDQIKSLKEGKSISKPIYNHVNGTLDTPETIEPTPIVIIEGLHPIADEKVRSLLDFSIYLDISDEIKFAWKIQRDMAERGWTLEQVQESIEARKPDFSAYVEPQLGEADVVISVLPSETSKAEVGKHLKVKLVQVMNKAGLDPSFMLSKDATITAHPEVKADSDCSVALASYKSKHYGRDVMITGWTESLWISTTSRPSNPSS